MFVLNYIFHQSLNISSWWCDDDADNNITILIYLSTDLYIYNIISVESVNVIIIWNNSLLLVTMSVTPIRIIIKTTYPKNHNKIYIMNEQTTCFTSMRIFVNVFVQKLKTFWEWVVESKAHIFYMYVYGVIKYTPKNQPSTLKAIMWLTNLYTKMRFPFYSRKSFTMWPLMIEPTDTIKCCENPKTFWTVAMKFHWI